MEGYICKSCGSLTKGKTETPGNFFIEVILWCCYIVPGLLYSIWRRSKRHKICEWCKSPDLIPPDSPIALEIRRKIGERMDYI